MHFGKVVVLDRERRDRKERVSVPRIRAGLEFRCVVHPVLVRIYDTIVHPHDERSGTPFEIIRYSILIGVHRDFSNAMVAGVSDIDVSQSVHGDCAKVIKGCGAAVAGASNRMLTCARSSRACHT